MGDIGNVGDIGDMGDETGIGQPRAAGDCRDDLAEGIGAETYRFTMFGTLPPPAGIDPEMRAPTPQGGNTPVIPPPGSSGGDPSVRPK